METKGEDFIHKLRLKLNDSVSNRIVKLYYF